MPWPACGQAVSRTTTEQNPKASTLFFFFKAESMVGVYSIGGSVALQVGIYDDICVALNQSHPLKLSAVLVIRHLWHLKCG